MPSFEWDARKALRNLRKHRVPFEEACFVFTDPLSLTVPELHDVAESRFVTIGKSALGRLLVVVHERGETIRLISARVATKHERITYEEGT